MRKMTKTVAVLAAMSAMTVASASLACAATPQLDNVSAVSDNKEAAASAAVVGSWSQDKAGNWSFTKEDGKKLKNTWAKIDGVWYYFDGETMAQDSFLIIDEKGYFFDGEGRMATGWQKITSKMDAYSDIDIPSKFLDYSLSNNYTQVDEDHEYDYHDFVWCYFDGSGVAKENEWFQDTDGKWYYFDENVMVKNIYDYEVNPDNYDVKDSSKVKLYGFDENGAMLVGWNSKKTPTTWNNPTADQNGKVWYYYKSNGEMQQKGWAQIGDNWYLFADRDADGGDANGKDTANWNCGGYPLIVNSYVASYKNGTSKEYFYVNKDGKLQSGVQNVRKAWKVLFYNQDKQINVAYEQVKVADKDIYVNFADSNYAAKEAIVNDSYYAMKTGNDIVKAEFGDTKAVRSLNNKVLDATRAFNNYNSIIVTPWSLTDAGDALDSTVTDTTIAGYVNKTDFRILTKAAYETGIAKKPSDPGYVDASDYFAMAASDNANAARTTAARAYDTKVTAETIYTNKKAAWDAVVGTSTVSVTGYDAAIAPGLAAFENNAQTYNALVAARDAKRTAAEDAYENWQLAINNDASAATINARKNAYITADAEAAEYEKACTSVEGEALFDDIMANKAVYDAYVAAGEDKADAEKDYADAKAAAMKYDYSKFENNWDDAIDSLTTNFAVVGELVKNAFIGRKDDLYVADADGEFVTSKAILVDKDANITYGNTTYDNAYILLGSDGKAARGYEGTKKSITIGGVTYWATDVPPFTLGKASATIFVANKAIDGKY